MKYYLSNEQYNKLWDNTDLDKWDQDSAYYQALSYQDRLKYWNSNYYHTKLSYHESDSGYYSIIEGDEHHITMFLLQL